MQCQLLTPIILMLTLKRIIFPAVKFFYPQNVLPHSKSLNIDEILLDIDVSYYNFYLNVTPL